MSLTKGGVAGVTAALYCMLNWSLARAEQPADYYSLHREPVPFTYRAADGSWVVDELRWGFQSTWDLTDPKVLCMSETGPCDTPEKAAAVRVEDRLVSYFKVFVPPGTLYAQIMIYLWHSSEIATVSRFDQPPTTDYGSWSYSDFPIDSDAGGTLGELTTNDYLTRNSGGHTTVVDQHFGTPLVQGGWIYVKVLSLDGSTPQEIRYTLRADVPTFVDWYQTVDWAVFNAEENGTAVPTCTDNDHDTYGSGCAAGPDCNDGNAAVNPVAQEVCNGIDDNCNGATDESGCGSCTDGDGDGYGQGCTLGPDCNDGSDAIHPNATEQCNSIDDDCDGATDETWSNLSSSCTAGQGACAGTGTVVCAANGAGVTCTAVAGQPAPEVCTDGADNDCDGLTDQNDPDCETCTNGAIESCYSGSWQTEDVGECRAGERVCVGQDWGPCNDQVLPELEDCDDGRDNDCDGRADSADLDCGPCRDGNQSSCYEGPASTEGVGECHAGLALCMLGQYLGCQDQSVPQPEICDDGFDNDCDGNTDHDDDDCEGCVLGDTRDCYGGATGTEGVGACHGGYQTCVDNAWGLCDEEQRPVFEVCGNGVDNDCDGLADNDDGDCWDCTAGAVEACYDGPSGTQGVGRCHPGERTCGEGGWGPCEGQALPSAPVCDDNGDDDCDGATDTDVCDAQVEEAQDQDLETDPLTATTGCLSSSTPPMSLSVALVVLAFASRRRLRRRRPE